MLVGLSFSTTPCNYHSYTSHSHKDTNSEKTKETLSIMPKIAFIKFLLRSHTCVNGEPDFVLWSFWSWSFWSNSTFDDLRKIQSLVILVISHFRF